MTSSKRGRGSYFAMDGVGKTNPGKAPLVVLGERVWLRRHRKVQNGPINLISTVTNVWRFQK